MRKDYLKADKISHLSSHTGIKKMKIKNISVLVVVCFVVLCGLLVVQSGFLNSADNLDKSLILLQATDSNTTLAPAQIPAAEQTQPQLAAAQFKNYNADDAEPKTLIIGAQDPETENPLTGYKLSLELSSRGAGIRKATFTNGDNKGFTDLDPDNPKPLEFISPVVMFDGSEILSMANSKFVFVDDQLQLPLNKLQWKSLPVEKTADGGQKAVFETVINEGSLKNEIIKITKSFQINPDSYDVKVNVNLENLSSQQQKVRFDMTGPVGIEVEGARQDMRKVLACFKNAEGKFTSDRKEIRKLEGQPKEKRRLMHDADKFIWASVTNKYFAAILVPQPDLNNEYCDWVADKFGRHYNPNGIKKDGDETLGIDISIASNVLKPASQPGSTRSYDFSLYLGPKDKSFFDKNEQYSKLGFIYSIDFRACCLPSAMIRPLVFGILILMKWMYIVIPNYGIVIIILVFFIRLLMHPITKKSQISMQKFSKIAPKVEELKKKYGNNKAELNKHTMALYKEQGASPIMGFLPMLVQMPIWISLYSAIYASIDLRGAAFLPFWITDLSAPDALIRFSAITIPILGYKLVALNLLPLLMGVAFYLQQKMMPKNVSANPQAAQQQKMMMLMMPIMFPLMLYSAPSGLNLYIMASTFAGVIEQHVIRRHIQQQEHQESSGLVSATSKTGGKVKKKKPKPFYKNT